MLFRVLLPNGRTGLYRGSWEREGSPLGWRVLVPEGTTGVVAGVSEGTAGGEVSFPDEAPLLGSAQISVVEEVAGDYFLPRGRVLFGLLPSVFLWKRRKLIRPALRETSSLDPRSREIVEYVRRRRQVSPEGLRRKFGSGVVRLLLRKGFLIEESEWVIPRVEVRYYRLKVPLSSALRKVRSQRRRRLILFLSGREGVSEEELLEGGFRREELRDLLRRGILELTHEPPRPIPGKGVEVSEGRLRRGRTLLWGNLQAVLGALKELCARNLSEGRSTLLIAPELKDAERAVQVLRGEFGNRVHEIHSRVPPKRIFSSWFSLQREAGVLVGTYTAALCPLKNLSSVILLNESSPAVKVRSAGGVDLRRIAFLLSRKTGADLLFATPSPSVATYLLVRDGRMEEIDLRRPHPVRVIARKPSEILTSVLLEKLTRFRGKEILLLVPKQGYSYVFCPRCEDLVQCPVCGTFMTYSRRREEVYCTACGHRQENLRCADCEGDLEELGFGVEKVIAAVEEAVGPAESFSFSTYPDWGEEFDATVVVSADSLLSLPTYRAKEELFLYLNRAVLCAREETLVQTVLPEEEVFRLLAEGRERDFYLRELESREREKLPPFWKLALVKTSRRDLAGYVSKVISPHIRVSYSVRENCYHILLRFRERRTLRKIAQLRRRFGRDIIEVRVDPL